MSEQGRGSERDNWECSICDIICYMMCIRYAINNKGKVCDTDYTVLLCKRGERRSMYVYNYSFG